MARALSFALDKIQLSDTERSPAFQVLLYDVRSTVDTINTVVQGALVDAATTGPLDITDFIDFVDVTERAGYYLEGGVQASTLAIQAIDPDGIFDPLGMLADPTGDARWFRVGNVVRVILGDTQVDQADWEIIFTGTITNSPSYSRSRQQGPNSISFAVTDRTQAFLGPTTSIDFGINTTYATVASDVAETEMGLDASEISFAGFGTNTLGHVSTQFVEDSPLNMLANIMIIDGFLPRFRGDGKLTQTLATTSGFPTRFYADLNLFGNLNIQAQEGGVVDSVCVLGLDANLSKIIQPLQDLAEVQLTTGWFAQDEDFKIHWSEDRTVIAENIKTKVLRSINGSVNMGGNESFQLLPAPDAGVGTEGNIGMRVTVDTGYAPHIIIFMAVNYLAAAWIPDIVVAFISGETIPATLQ